MKSGALSRPHLLQAEHFGLQVPDAGVALVLLLGELPVGGLQFGEPDLELLGAPLVGRLQLPPQLVALLLQPRLNLHQNTLNQSKSFLKHNTGQGSGLVSD